MVARESESPETQFDLRFMVAVIDGCIASEWAALELLGNGSRPQQIQMFYAHRGQVHSKPNGLPFGRLQVMFQYLEDLLGLDASASSEYEEHMRSGRHVLLANVYCDNDAKAVASVLGRAQSHNGRVLGYGHAARLQPLGA
ncbi:MAG: hypothetical protein HQ475_05450 [SAR202 cluster bacterium]|nr:hypothetical protein [SAR202 cluster bacterium]